MNGNKVAGLVVTVMGLIVGYGGCATNAEQPLTIGVACVLVGLLFLGMDVIQVWKD
jgi:hypothetical protein